MSTTSLQAFRAQSSSKVVSIPTRYDGKSKQHVIRWKDIQLRFKDAQYVMNNEATVLFLTDDDLEDLIPLRIAHHPGIVLEVVITDDNQGIDDDQDVSIFTTQSNDSDVPSLRIHDADNSRALVVHSQGQPLPSAGTSHFQLGTGRKPTMRQQQKEEGKQPNQQTQHAQQQMQDQIDKMLQTSQQMNQQHIKETQRLAQLSEELQQRMQQLDQEIHDLRQQTQDIQGQAQRQMDEVLRKIQEMDLQAQSARQQQEPWQQQLPKVEKICQKQDHSSLERNRRETPHIFDQFFHARCRVQVALAKPSQSLSTPRLFILLPAPTTVADRQGGLRPLRFRLHFLCECGTHTMSRNCKEQHEVHLANHPGYDLHNQDEFIAKYGSYLLTMMYMVKYGAKARGLVVPPLLGLNHAIDEGEGIGQITNNTIAYLKEATGCIDGDTTTHQSLDDTELTELESYLKIKDGESFSGGLSRMKIQKAHYSWICSDHLLECYESNLRELIDHVNASNGVWHGNEVKVKVTSETTTKLFYDSLSKLFRIQSVENWRAFTEIDLKLNSHPLMSSSTADSLGSLDNLESLSLEFVRLTMSAKIISRGELKDVSISIRDLSAPTLDDLEFIQQCRPTALTVLETPQEKDDICLVNILQSYPSITNLRINCDMKRLTAVICLVTSTREKMIQGENESALRIFELVHPEIKVKVSFAEGSPVFDVETSIKFGNCEPHVIDPAVYAFVRQYGWSVTTLVVPWSFSDRLAKLLDESIQEKGSMMVHFDVDPWSLTTPGLDAISRVINLLRDPTYLRLSLGSLHGQHEKEKALLLLGRHKDRLTSLRLHGWNVEEWLSQIARAFPDRDGFPVLKEFFVECWEMDALDGNTGQWIASMISARAQPLTPLKAFSVYSNSLWPKGLETIINAIDLSALEELHIRNGDFSFEQLKLVVDRIGVYGAPSLPLRLLHIEGKNLHNDAKTHELFVSLREKVPGIHIMGIKA